MIIKSGTYRLNDELTTSTNSIDQAMNFIFVLGGESFGGEALISCDLFEVINYTHFDIYYNWVSSSVDLSSLGLSVPHSYCVYTTTMPHLGWGVSTWGEGIKTITITEDTKVSGEFYVWFTENTVEQESGEFIYNRTQQDVDNAKRIRLEKVQKFLDLTDDDIAVLERGFVTINTLNRIESKQRELKSLLSEAGYYSDFESKTWTNSDYSTSSDLKRICENTKKLRASFFVYNRTPENPMAKYYFEEFNKIEKILVDISYMIASMVSRYRRCGTFNCGG